MKQALMLGAALAALGSAPAAAEQGDILVRLRAITVAPLEDSSAVLPTFPGAEVSVDNAYVPELDFTYFFTNNIAAELILATSPHDISGEGSLAGLEIADIWTLPPTLTLQYHFRPAAKIRPYVGVGINYTIFYNEDATGALENAIGATAVELDDSVGVAGQVGFDMDITDRLFFNADVKFIQMDTTATLTTGALINTVDVDLNPIVAGVGVGIRF